MTGRAGTNGDGRGNEFPVGPRAPEPGTDAPFVQTPAPADTGAPLRRTVRVVNPHGLHPRVADRFTRTVARFNVNAVVLNGDARADGKNIWDLILLVVLPGTEVVLELDGPDARAALDPLCEILASPGGEDHDL